MQPLLKKVFFLALVICAVLAAFLLIPPLHKACCSSLYKTFTSPNGNWSVKLYRFDSLGPITPGSSSDAPGYIRLVNREGRVLAETSLPMVQLVEQVEWSYAQVRIKLIAQWALPEVAEADSIVGVYKVAARTCRGTEVQKDTCESVAFIEFSRGGFAQMNDKQIAFVVWRGNAGEELLYTASPYQGDIHFSNGSLSAVISRDDTAGEQKFFSEEIRLSSAKEGVYTFVEQGFLNSEWQVRQASLAELAEYQMVYPNGD